MSERELREWAGSGGGTIVLCNPDDACADCQELYDALAADPDVVVLLRWLKTNQQTEERYLSEKRRRSEHDTHHRQGARNAFRDTIVTIEQSFGIRLTDDGYEWVDDA